MKRLQVVAGGTSGMGLATAKALGKFGPVLVGGRNEKRLADAVAKLEADGVEAYGKTVDIADRASLDEFAAYAVSIAPLGNVVNAAGVDTGGGDLIVKVNMVGTVNFVEAFLPYLEEGSALVNYSSITGYFVQPTPEEREIWDDPNNPAFFDKVKAAIDAREVPEAMRAMGEDYQYYPISKTFTQYYTRANTRRFGKRGCRIFSIAPGAFDTPMLREASEETVAGIERGTAFGRLGDSDEMAEFIVRMLEPGLEYLTGVDLILDGGKFGMTMAKQLD
ncbi:MAG TPA: SDR family oxidoreductase [Coriobacteriaceae bacterium]|nr:SDR family oxidoreductase [Coriobacteriaceae bacterium]